ncbi:flavodoxin domain-containing protein [Patulibacter americanus]|uniref:flavodoxin domain-containing protein n=1 Tax=Patulibacter americanus TaxID=588672 RepID=UPI0003B4C071|nr:flavodoxin domain-containing protein [Patulibacter americanus]
MTAPTCLLVFASTHGHVRRIAEAVADRLRGAGVVVDVRDVEDAPASTAGYDLVVLGGSIHAERHQAPLVAWMRRHAEGLAGRRVALFSVSLAALDPTPDGRAKVGGWVDALLEATGVRPDARACIAGALPYRDYALPTRWLMRRIARKQGLPTDTSRNHDLTDWAAVQRFADEAAALVAVRTPA